MNSLYINVPYSEKDYAKKLGARWDPQLKKWYCISEDLSRVDDYYPFKRWIMDNQSEAIIATEDLYIVESKRICWKCKKTTTVVALGVSSYIGFEEDDGEIYIGEYSYKIHDTKKKPIQLAWVETEKQIPPMLLQFLKNKYNVNTDYSSIAGKCFANHCEHCGSIQGTWYLFFEPDGPFPMNGLSAEQYEERISNLTIFNISLYDDLALNWSVFNNFQITQYKWMKIYNNFLLDGEKSVYGYKELYYK